MTGPAKSSPRDDARKEGAPTQLDPAHDGAPNSEDQIDAEQPLDAETLMKQVLDWVGPDTPAGKEMLRQWEADKAPIPRPAKAEAEETQLIDLRLLEDNPLHRRHQLSSEERTALARSIEANGLKNAIEVRPKGDKFEIICGHRRVDAYRTLLQLALTDSERAKYQAIRAKVRPGASDRDVVRWGIADDLLREEFPALDAATSIHVLRNLEPELGSAKKLSEATGLPFKRVARYLQVAKASEVVRDAMRSGVTVEDEGDEGGAHQEERKLDLRAALEFERLHAALAKKNGKSDKEEESFADRQTRQAIKRALTENWGYRDVKRSVDKAISALDAPGPKKVRGRPRVPFKWDERRLQVDVNLLDTLSALQKQELRKVIEGILGRL